MGAREIIAEQGEEKILSRIRGGDSQAEIARSIGVSSAFLCEWLHEDGERSARARLAMAASAESWLDRGLEALQNAEPEAAEIARARAIEQHCARRAAIRDPKRYGDKIQAEHTGADGGPLQMLLGQLGKTSIPVNPDPGDEP